MLKCGGNPLPPYDAPLDKWSPELRDEILEYHKDYGQCKFCGNDLEEWDEQTGVCLDCYDRTDESRSFKYLKKFNKFNI